MRAAHARSTRPLDLALRGGCKESGEALPEARTGETPVLHEEELGRPVPVMATASALNPPSGQGTTGRSGAAAGGGLAAAARTKFVAGDARPHPVRLTRAVVPYPPSDLRVLRAFVVRSLRFRLLDGKLPPAPMPRQNRRMPRPTLFPWDARITLAIGVVLASTAAPAGEPTVMILDSSPFRARIERFNELYAADPPVGSVVPDEQAWEFLSRNAPRFDCPDPAVTEVYAYRWWLFRKHIKEIHGRRVITEFIKLDPICCPAGHHFYEGRWLRDGTALDEYSDYWFSEDGQPRRYSFWAADAFHARYEVALDRDWVVGHLDNLVRNYRAWEESHLRPDGLFVQEDDRDGMERSIGGSGRRPTINAYMYGDAVAIARIAELAGRPELAVEYAHKAAELKDRVQSMLWDPQAHFFKTRGASGLVDVREAVGFVPWYFGLPDPGYEAAWEQLSDPHGFSAPYGPTTAERRHPRFMALGPEEENTPWDGPSWPYATTQTLVALANVLNDYDQAVVSAADWRQAFDAYTRSHYSHYGDGRPVVWEWVHPTEGTWYVRDWDEERCGKHYNHSAYCDLVITGLAGIRPRGDDVLVVNPLAPRDWDYLCLDGVRYHGHELTVVWDRDGRRYGRGRGLALFCDGRELARSDRLTRLTASLPAKDEEVKP